MTDYTPDLHLPLVAPNQDQKETTINTALAILEASANDSVLISLSAGNVTLNDDQYTKYFLHQFNGNTVARIVTLPNTRRWFGVENQGSASITFKITGSTGLTAELPSGKIGLLFSDGVDLRYIVPDPTGGLGLLADLSDVSGVPTDGQLLRWFAAESTWKPWTLSLPFTGLSDTPPAYTGAGGRLVGVKADGSGLEFVVSSANVNSFVDLDDTPDTYGGSANLTVKVNSAGSGLTFAAPRFTEASDTPANYTGAAGRFVKVNSTTNGLIFAAPVVADLSDGPGAPTAPNALRYLRVNAAGTAVEYATGTGGPDDFLELADTPNTYTGASLKFVRVGVDEDQLIFANPQFTDLSDVPHSYTGAGGKFLQVKSGTEDQIIFAAPKVGDLSDGPTAPTLAKARQVVRVNVAGTALEYYALKITDLGGFPTTFTGQGGKYLVVKADESGVQFSTSSYTTSFLALNDVPAESYAGLAGRPFVVDPTQSGLIPGPIIPTKLGQLADVEDGTGTPTEGYVLTWKDGVWQAEPSGGSAGSSTLAGLTDVDFTTPPVGGNLLSYNATTHKWVPGTASSVAALNDLTDVTISSPVAGQALVYRSGVWVNEDSVGQGVPSNGSHPYWRLLLHTTDGSTAQFGIQEIEFKQTKTGADLATGGTASASTEESGQPASGAFDNTIGGAWFSTTAADGQWIKYAFPAPVEVRYLTIMGSQSRTTTSPASFSVQWSDDNTAWTTAWEVTGQTGWAPNQIREFHAPLDLFFTDLADVPQSYIGQVGKSLRVNTGSTGLEFFTPITTVASLTDVNFAAPPVEGQVLTYTSGVWKAQTPGEVVPAAPHAYWRVRATPVATESYFTLGEVEFLDAANADQTTGGTPLASSEFGGAYLKAYAFDNLTTTHWGSATGDMQSGDGAWIGYQFASEVSVSAITLQTSTTQNLTEAPIGTLNIEWSDDGVTWFLQWAVLAGGTWTATEKRTYAAPINNTTLAGLTDVNVPSPTDGQVLTYDITTHKWIASSASSATLAGLTDVDVSPAPTEGQVLTYNDTSDKWEPRTPTTSSGDALVDPGYHPYWRIKAVAAETSATSLAGLRMYRYGSIEETVSGTPDAGNTASGSSASNAFDGNDSTVWLSNAIDADTWIGYDFSGSVKISRIDIRDVVGGTARPPSAFLVQYADATVDLPLDWRTSWSVSGINWDDAGGQLLDFSAPTDRIRMENLSDVIYPTGFPNDADSLVWSSSDERWIAAVPPAPTLGELQDVTVGGAIDGFVLTYESGGWIAAAPNANPTYISPHGAHSYWRILVSAVDGSTTNTSIAQFDFAAVVDGPLLTLDTANASASSTTSGHLAAAGFDENNATFWQGATSTGEWLAYHFVDAPTEIMEVFLTSADAGDPTQMPATFDVQYSDNGSSYTTAWTVTGSTGWTSIEQRHYTDPGVTIAGPVTTFTQLSDVPASYTGGAGKQVRVNATEDGLEFANTNADFGCFIAGKPTTTEKVVRFIVATPFTILTGTHQGSADAASTASKVFSFTKNGTEFLTATFAAAGSTATFSANTATSFAAGDVLAIVAPVTPDVTLADISFTLKGQR